jgi:hypothetical protein
MWHSRVCTIGQPRGAPGRAAAADVGTIADSS